MSKDWAVYMRADPICYCCGQAHKLRVAYRVQDVDEESAQKQAVDLLCAAKGLIPEQVTVTICEERPNA